MAAGGSAGGLVFFAVMTAWLVIQQGAAASASNGHLAIPAAGRGAVCNGSIAQCLDGEEWPPTESAGIRRSLTGYGNNYLGYNGLGNNRPATGNAKSGQRYARGCNDFTRCRESSHFGG